MRSVQASLARAPAAAFIGTLFNAGMVELVHAAQQQAKHPQA